MGFRAPADGGALSRHPERAGIARDGPGTGRGAALARMLRGLERECVAVGPNTWDESSPLGGVAHFRQTRVGTLQDRGAVEQAGTSTDGVWGRAPGAGVGRHALGMASDADAGEVRVVWLVLMGSAAAVKGGARRLVDYLRWELYTLRESTPPPSP